MEIMYIEPIYENDASWTAVEKYKVVSAGMIIFIGTYRECKECIDKIRLTSKTK